MRRLLGGAVLVAGAVASVGCRTPMFAGADYDPSVVIGQPATFAWNEADAVPVGEPRLDNNPFFVAQLHGAIARELSARGIRMAVGTRPPTLLVHHHATIHDEIEVYPTEQLGALSPYGPGTQVYQWEEGNFLVDMVDARTNKVIWRGWARTDLAGSLEDAKQLDAVVSDAIARMFEYFPIPKGTLPVEEPPVIEPVPEIGIPFPDVAGPVPPMPPAQAR